MPATPGLRSGRRAIAGLAATALLTLALVTGVPAPQAGGATTGNEDALQARVRAELGVFTGWLANNGVRGYIGEVGWPNNADTAQWNALATKWYADAAAAGVWTTAWATGEWWGCGYKLSIYVWSTCSTMDGTLNVARSQAPIIESQASPDNRGVNVAGGEFGTPGPLDATSSFSNANPGVYDRAYHYDLSPSFAYLASRGISLVRLPIRWERVQPNLDGPLDAMEVQRISAAVSRAQAAGLRVILDVHNYGAYWLFDGAQGVRQPIGSASVTVTHFAGLWRLLSTSFAGHSGVAGYGLMNEPVGMAGAQHWEQASQAAVSAIRRNGDAKLVLVPGYNWSGAQQWTSQHPAAWISDPYNNIRYEAHHYFDRDNSGAYLNSYASEVSNAQARGYVASPTSTTQAPATTTTLAPTTTTTLAPTTTTTLAPTTTTTLAPAVYTIAPSAPVSLSAVASKKNASLSWSASVDSGGSGLAGYEVFRSLSPAGPWTKVMTTGSTSWLDRDVSRWTAYFYQVRAYDRAGNRSAASPTATVLIT
jgi:hypothetical protein